jgi:hypothetical protein
LALPHPTLIHASKSQLLDGAEMVFANSVRVEGVTAAFDTLAKITAAFGTLAKIADAEAQKPS